MREVLAWFRPDEVIILNKRVIGFLCALVMPLAVAQRSKSDDRQQIVRYSPVTTLLTGVVKKEYRFGPPGFGETPKTDPRISIVVLKLDTPITAVPDTKKKEEINTGRISDIRSVQLWFKGDEAVPPLEVFARKHIGRRVRVEGVVDEAVAPMEFTTLIVTVSKLTLDQ